MNPFWRQILPLGLVISWLLSGAAAAHGGDSSKPARSLRPFYLIGHGANTLAEAREYLALGANALEVDVNLLAGSTNVLCIGHGPLMGAGPTAKKHSVPLAEFLRGLHDLAHTNLQFCLVYFDCKTLAATPELGELLLDNIRTNLTGGDDPVDLLTLISVGKLKEKAMFAHIATNLGPREALMVDGYSDPAAVSHFFTESGVTNQAFSDGIVPLNPLLTHLQVFGAVSKACRLRDQQHQIRFVGTWTVNNPWLMTRFINMGVDGIIVDRRFVWYNFSFANWGQGLSSLTKIVHKRGELLGVRPANRNDNPFDLNGPREQPAIASRHDAKPPDDKPF